MMDAGALQLSSGDRLILSTGGVRRVLLVSAVNNQVVKYFDETGQYGQMPRVHLVELAKNHQLKIETGDQGQALIGE
ncbi:MAG TPA: hypothetical protein VN631_07955 [Negativicutes bacterium]|nr:hypothetical protein [Negativicutes bacterium]